MADSENSLKHMRRDELVEIIYRYQQNEKALTEENESLKEELESRRIKIDQAGSVAEAALSLYGVFESAQAAADQYLTELRFSSSEADEYAQKAIEDAKARAAIIIEEAEKERENIKHRTEEECEEMKKQAKEECARIKARIEDFLKSRDELKSFLNRKNELRENG